MDADELLKFCREQKGQPFTPPNVFTRNPTGNECVRMRWEPEDATEDAIELVASQLRGMHHDGLGSAIVNPQQASALFNYLGEGEGVDFPMSELNYIVEPITFLGAPTLEQSRIMSALEMTPRDPMDESREAPFEYLVRTLCDPFSSKQGTVAALTSMYDASSSFGSSGLVCYRHAKSVATADDATRLGSLVRMGQVSKRVAANLMAHYCSEMVVGADRCGHDTAGNPVGICTNVQAEKVAGARPCTDWLQGNWQGPKDTSFWTSTDDYNPDDGDVPYQFRDTFIRKVCDRNPELPECDCEKAGSLPVGCTCGRPADGRCAYRCAVWRSMARLNQCGSVRAQGVLASDGPRMCWLPACQEHIMVTSRTALSKGFACPDICGALASVEDADRSAMNSILMTANCGGMERDGVVDIAEYRRRRYEEGHMFAFSRTATSALEKVVDHTAEIILLTATVMIAVTVMSVVIATKV